MKQVCSKYSLAALLLAAIAVSLAGTSLRMVVADGLPVPWPKKPAVVMMPTVVADGLPVPWPKKPVALVAPAVVADGMPVPWPKKPGSVVS